MGLLGPEKSDDLHLFGPKMIQTAYINRGVLRDRRFGLVSAHDPGNRL
jgi:hypothetical protein